MKNWTHKLPTREQIFASRFFKPLAPWFEHEYFWVLDCNRVALATAIGLYCGMVPTPFQFLTAFILAYIFRAHLPVALFATLYTNPITLVPIYIAAYELGIWLLYGNTPHPELVFPVWQEGQFWSVMTEWITTFGTPWLLGSCVIGSVLALAGYTLVQVVWRWQYNR